MSLPDSHTTRRYVDVIARWRDDGVITPLSVCWPDGRTFQIERVIGQPIANSFSDKGTRTLRYTVQIGNRETHLYLEQEITEKGSTDSGMWRRCLTVHLGILADFEVSVS